VQTTGGQRKGLLLVPLSLVLLISVSWSSPSIAESHDIVEVRPFGVLDTDASVSIRYLLDENDRSTESSASTFENRATWEQEVLLASTSYVYHPGFLNMEIAGGPLLVQQAFDTNAGTSSSNDTLVNFLARFNFLDLKSYPFSLYFQRSHPSLTTSLSGRFLTRNDEFGFRGRHTGLLKGTELSLDLSHRDTEGSGFGSIVDEDVDRAFFGWQTSYRDDDRISIEFDRYTQASLSGSTGLPIQESEIEQATARLIARNHFGSKKQILLNQSLFVLEQETVSQRPSEFENLYYTASTLWQNSDTIQSSFNYRFNDSRRTDADAETHNMRANVNHAIGENSRYYLFVDHEEAKQTGFSRSRTGGGGGINYSKPLGFGTLGIAGSVRQERNDQESTSDSVQIFDEPVTLDATTPVDLANDFVVASSVVVTNTAGTQVFIEGADYRLIVVGSTTSIQRLIDGNIFDGQTVLVDYEYLTSGTAKFDRLSANISATLDFLEYAHAQVRYGFIGSDLLSGEFTTPINDAKAFEVTLGADFPVGESWRIGGEIRHLDQDEDIAPYVRDSVSLNASTRVYGSLHLYMSASRVEVDQATSTEDVDQATYRLGIRGVPFGRAQLSFETTYLEDVGGSLPRDQLQHRLTLQGRYRMVRYFLRAIVSEEALGVTQRNYTQITAGVTRDF
jgi:hypothetical protein